jgi:hypothetical protein
MPSGQLTVWNGESFALSTDCRVRAARAVGQACALSEHLTSVKRIERNIEESTGTPREKAGCHLKHTRVMSGIVGNSEFEPRAVVRDVTEIAPIEARLHGWSTSGEGALGNAFAPSAICLFDAESA